MRNAKNIALALIALVASAAGLSGCGKTVVTYCDNAAEYSRPVCDGCVDIKVLYGNDKSKYGEWLENPTFCVNGRKAASVTTISFHGYHFHYRCEI